MATSAQSGDAVVGYFESGDQAHRAINALVSEGFTPAEIGAAFHVGAAEGNSAPQRQPNLGGSLREELGTTHPESYAGNATGGPASGSNEVQANVLGAGAGRTFDGAGRPGPIPGSSLANTGLPSELRGGLPHESDVERTSPVRTSYDTDVLQQETTPAHAGHQTWGDRLRSVFGKHAEHDQTNKQTDGDSLQAQVAKDSRDFGTGEGDLHLANVGGMHRYSQPAFEQSFAGYGVQSEQARHLSERIGHGGAIVTVHSATRANDAERVLAAHGGQVRFSAGLASIGQAATDGQVEVFGPVHRDYQSYNR